MDRAQRQLIADAICEKWDSSREDNELESDVVYGRVAQEDARIERSDFLGFLRDLKEADLISGVIFHGHVRITGVSNVLYEEPLN